MTLRITRQIITLFAGLTTCVALSHPLPAAAREPPSPLGRQKSPFPATSAADEAAVRAIIEQGVVAWTRGDGDAYAAAFIEDADYVTFGGMHLKGQRAIASVHQQLFDTVLKRTRLQGQIKSVRFVSPDVVLAHTTHAILFPGQSEVAPDRKSIQTLVLVKRDGKWRVAALQVTRVQP
jgi:uncharacterized protein (TIGR02246 family)